MSEILQTVLSGRLKIDPAYQRPLNEKRVAKIAAQWDQRLAGALHVSDRNGVLYVVDGQHRLAAGRLAGVREQAVVIHEGLTPAEEAALFITLNVSQIKLDATSRFWALVEAGDPTALLVADLCQQFNIEIVRQGSGNGHFRGLRATTLALDLAAAGLLRPTFQVLTRALKDDPDQFNMILLGGVGSLIYVWGQHPHYSQEDLIRKLSITPASSLIRRSRQLGESGVGGKGATGIRRFNRAPERTAVWEMYNSGRRTRRLPEVTQSDMKLIFNGGNPWV